MSLASWMTMTIYIAHETARDSAGKATYGTPAAVAARVEGKRRSVKKANGDEAFSAFRIYTLTPISLSDRIWLPGTSSAVAAQSNVPLAIDSTPDKSGARTLYQVDL